VQRRIEYRQELDKLTHIVEERKVVAKEETGKIREEQIRQYEVSCPFGDFNLSEILLLARLGLTRLVATLFP